jgi:hypothetical protein
MDRTGPKILCAKPPIVMGNFNGNALAQKIAKKGKNRTLKHYERPPLVNGRWCVNGQHVLVVVDRGREEGGCAGVLVPHHCHHIS